jgi:hypothetical protein
MSSLSKKHCSRKRRMLQRVAACRGLKADVLPQLRPSSRVKVAIVQAFCGLRERGPAIICQSMRMWYNDSSRDRIDSVVALASAPRAATRSGGGGTEVKLLRVHTRSIRTRFSHLTQSELHL